MEPACTGDFYAGSFSPPADSWVNGTECETAFSGGDPFSNIESNAIGPDTVQAMDGQFFYNMYGIGLTYTGGEICSLTNEPRTFTVNVYCKENVDGDYTGLTNGDECNPHVNIVSKFGCPVLDFSDIV